MKIAVIEPIGISSEESTSQLSMHTVVACDSRHCTDEQLMEFVSDADVIALTNRRLSAAVINAQPD